jgi:hypothetical protein
MGAPSEHDPSTGREVGKRETWVLRTMRLVGRPALWIRIDKRAS